MRIGIAFGVAVRTLARNQSIEERCYIRGYIGIGVLVDCDASGGVRDINVADAAVNARLPNDRLNFAADVHQLGAAGSLDLKSFSYARDKSGNRNDEVRADILDAGVAFDLLEPLLPPASSERQETQFARLQRLFRIQEVRQEFLVGCEDIELVIKGPANFLL